MPSMYLITLPFIGVDICNSARRNKICQEVSERIYALDWGLDKADGSVLQKLSLWFW